MFFNWLDNLHVELHFTRTYIYTYKNRKVTARGYTWNCVYFYRWEYNFQDQYQSSIVKNHNHLNMTSSSIRCALLCGWRNKNQPKKKNSCTFFQTHLLNEMAFGKCFKMRYLCFVWVILWDKLILQRRKRKFSSQSMLLCEVKWVMMIQRLLINDEKNNNHGKFFI